MVDQNDAVRRLQAGIAAALSSAGSVAGGGTRGSGSSGPEPRVYFGTKRSMPLRRRSQTATQRALGLPGPSMIEVEPDYPKRVVERDDARPYSAALGAFYGWTEDERAEWGRYLASIGYIDPEDADDYSTLLKAWNEVIDESARFTAAGKKMDPWAVARVIAGTDNDGGSGGGGRTRAGRERGFTGSRTSRSTDTQIDLTDGETARALVNQTLSKFLGRNATDQEISSFTTTLNNAERANPITAVTTTTDTFEDGLQTGSTSSTTKSGGLSAAGKAQTLETSATNLPEYGAYQAAIYYFPLLQQAIQATA